jgi:transcription elongation factor S-II
MTSSMRQQAITQIIAKTHIDETCATDLERGVYNWAIDYATDRSIIKNWGNPIFIQLYKDKFRSVLCNLDTESYIGNTRLIERLTDKEFSPHEIPFMTPDNMFPELWSEMIDIKLKLYEQIGENNLQAMTDQFVCGRCKKREVSYYELQTRSGDESMTIFAKCINCGNSWKM